MSPRIAILIPAYNVEQFIVRCIHSCLAQRRVSFFICCIDDGSSDSTYERLIHLAKEDVRINIKKHDHNMGPSATRNELLEWAGQIGCDYFMFVDADDWLENDDYCFEFLTYVITYHADLVVSPLFGNAMAAPSIVTYNKDAIISAFLRNNIHGGPTNKLFKYCLGSNCRFSNNICYAEDALFF